MRLLETQGGPLIFSLIRDEIEDVPDIFRRFTPLTSLDVLVKPAPRSQQPRRICLENFNYYLIEFILNTEINMKLVAAGLNFEFRFQFTIKTENCFIETLCK